MVKFSNPFGGKTTPPPIDSGTEATSGATVPTPTVPTETGPTRTVSTAAVSTTPVGLNKDLEELMLKLDLMQKECLEEKLNEEKEAIKDEFIVLKREIYKLLMETKDIIRVRYSIQSSKGNTVEVIQQNFVVKNKIQELEVKYGFLKEIFKKNVKQQGKLYTEEELDDRFKELQLIKEQITETKDLDRNAAMKTEAEVRTLTDFRSQMVEKGVVIPVPAHEGRELTGEEQKAMDQWKARDEQIDTQLGEVGDAVDRLRVIALEIGEKADKQAELVAGLHSQADEANENIVVANNQIKEIINKQGGMNICCKVVMTLVLVCLVFYTISVIKDRIFG